MRKQVLIGLAAAVVLLLAACVASPSEEDEALDLARKALKGFQLVSEGNCDEGVPLLRAGERAGQVDALFYLAHFHDLGRCVPHDPVRAFRLAKRLSIKLAGSKVLLGYFYLNGRGVEKDEKAAAYWFRESVLFLGYSHSDDREYFMSRSLLGRPIPDLLQKQLDWVNAVWAGSAEYQYQEAVNLLSDDPTADQLKMVERWLIEAAKKGNAKAHFRLGLAFADGLFEPPSDWKAYHHFVLAARLDHVGAQMEIARWRENGQHINRNYLSAYYWLLRARRKGADVDSEDLARVESKLTSVEIDVVNSWFARGRWPP